MVEREFVSDATHHGPSRRVVLKGGMLLAGGAGLALSGAARLPGGGIRGVVAQEATPVAAPEVAGAAVDPQMQEVLAALDSFNAPPVETVTPEIARNLPSFANAVQKVLADRGQPAVEAVGGIEHRLIPGPAGDLLVRLYRPSGAEAGPLPVIVYFHGGGFVIANLDTYDASCRALTNGTGAIVASVAYRQAPENPYPAAVDDAYAATQYFLANAGDHGGDPARVAVAGESAGGNLATVVCLRARANDEPMPVHQLLVYPVATFAPEGAAAESVGRFANAKPLNAAMLQWFASYYLPDPALAAEPAASPMSASDLSGLPSATVIAAEIDPLQSQGQLYAQALTDAGVETSYSLYEGVTHEFFGMGAVVDKAKEAETEAASALLAAFAGGGGTPTA